MQPPKCHPLCLSFNVSTLLLLRQEYFNTLRPRQNGRHFADVFKCIFLDENVWIPIKISLKFVPKCSINNISSLVQIMAWCLPGNKPLSEPMMVSSLMHICVTRSQWVNSSPPGQNGHHFADDMLRYIFVNEKFCSLIKISLKLFLRVQLTITKHWFR